MTNTQRLVLVRGLPGSGKSTFAKSLNIVHLEADMFHTVVDGGMTSEYRFEDRFYAHEATTKLFWLVQQALQTGVSVVVAGVFPYVRAVNRYRILAIDAKAEFFVVRCGGEYGNVHNVPDNVLKSMANHFEPYPGERFL